MAAEWHENHQRANRAVDQRVEAGWSPIIRVHVLLEAFAVLTHLPLPFRVKPEVARAALASVYPGSAAQLTPQDCFAAMMSIETMSLAGGKVYDAAIAECASRSGARLLLTFNAEDFLRVRPPGLEIVIPD